MQTPRVAIERQLPIERGNGFAPLVRPPPGCFTPYYPLHTSFYNATPFLFPFNGVTPPMISPAFSNPSGSGWFIGAPPVIPVPGDITLWPLYTPGPVGSFAFTPRDTPRWPPSTFHPQSFGSSAPLHLHPHLVVNPINPTIPIMQWDVLHRAEQARVYTGRQLLVPVELEEEAFVPSVEKVVICSNHPTLSFWMNIWGPIVIEKDQITICDILDAIFLYFQQPLTSEDCRRIRQYPEIKDRLDYSLQQRVRDTFELRDVAIESGYKRVDILGGHRRFQGLTPVIFQDNTWKLVLGLLPGPVPWLW